MEDLHYRGEIGVGDLHHRGEPQFCKYCLHYDICRDKALETMMPTTFTQYVSENELYNTACENYKPSPQKEIIDLLENISDNLSILLERKNNEEEL